MDRNYALEFVRVTEAAALASAKLMGRGDEKLADHAAVEAMRKMLNTIQFDGRVVIGEGERDEAPMLYIGEKVGKGGDKLDLALDPLEGTTLCAHGENNSLSVIAIAKEGHFLHAPDTYMLKIAVGPEARNAIDLNRSPSENLREIAKAKKTSIDQLTVVILDRPRHADLIQEVRSLGARIMLIRDGDVSAAIATCRSESTGVDVLMGTGGAPEGVIAAAALRCMGGNFQGRLMFRNEDEKSRAHKMGITDLNRTYQINELAKGNVLFCATGVTHGAFLKGVRFSGNIARTQSIVMRSETGTIRTVDAEHIISNKNL